MNNGYERAAHQLAMLHAADREWLLSQLPEEDRIQIRALLGAGGGNGTNGGAHAPAVVGSIVNGRNGAKAREGAVNAEISKRIEVIESAGGDVMQRVLRDEPVWVVATVLGYENWPWIEAFLRGYEREQIDQFARLVKTLNGAMKPRVKAAVITDIAQKVERLTPAEEERSVFDAILERTARSKEREA